MRTRDENKLTRRKELTYAELVIGNWLPESSGSTGWLGSGACDGRFRKLRKLRSVGIFVGAFVVLGYVFRFLLSLDSGPNDSLYALAIAFCFESARRFTRYFNQQLAFKQESN
jgi:hypothetical protein